MSNLELGNVDTGLRILANHRPLFRGEHNAGSLADLGMGKNELYNKSVCEIGLGAGISLYEIDAHNRNNPTQAIRYVGVDILLQIPDDRLSERNLFIKSELERAVQAFPSLFQSSNVLYGIDQPTDSFDYVISHYGMPEYANDQTEVVNIIFEMIRVAKEQVIFTGGWLDEDFEGLKAGAYRFGGTAGDFESFPFKLKKCIEELEQVGVTHTHRALTSVRLDTKNKDMKKLEQLRADILGKIGEFS